ncbi:MAG: ABC transporter substrate-binding protein, partial [Planctomycetota bacterium]
MMGVLRSQRLGLILLLGALAAACGEDARPEGGDNYERNKKLRKAICTALDWEERNDSFYNSKNVIYDGMIPPGLDGHPKNHKVEGMGYGGANIELAKKLLAEAGYPGGQGLPAIEYYTSKAGNSKEQAELLKRQLAEIGVKVNVRLVDFSTLIETINTKKAPFFAFAWSSDYPDAENNLALFYGPNESPGSNHFNYKNAEFDRLYEKVRSMKPGPERTALYEKMRDIVIEEAPFAGAMARTRHYVVQPALKNFKPVEDFYNWVKYLDVDKATSDGKKVLSLPMRTDGPKSLDPVQGSTVYDNRACTQVYQTLVQYKYLRRPLALEPLLLAEMP